MKYQSCWAVYEINQAIILCLTTSAPTRFLPFLHPNFVLPAPSHHPHLHLRPLSSPAPLEAKKGVGIFCHLSSAEERR